jgi:hypothetical protein
MGRNNMIINSRDIAKHLYRLSYFLESEAQKHLAIGINNQIVADIQKDSDEIKELAEFLYSAKQHLAIEL